MRRSNCIKVVTILFIILVSINSVRAINDQREIWTDIGGYTSWKDWSLSLTMGNYFWDRTGWYLINGELQVVSPSWHSFYFGLGYKQEYSQWMERWYVEYRPMLNLFYKKSFGKVKLRNRFRTEFRFVEGISSLRYRNELKCTLKGESKFKPYLSTELFLNNEPFKYTRNRSYIGTKWCINRLTLDSYVCWQVTKMNQELWHHLFVIGTGLYLKI